MSVYSGFATRQQELKYNNLLQNLVIALKKRLIKFYNAEPCDESKFKLLMKKIYKKMFLLEKGKFMTPKYSTCYNDFIEALNIDINYDSLSDASSMMSQTFSLKKEQSDGENDVFQSRAILEVKKNHLESQKRLNPLNNSTFSLSKKFNTLELEQKEEKKRSTSLGVDKQLQSNKSKAKFKLKDLRDIRELRGPMSMPKVEDFLPKKQEIAPAFFHAEKPLPKEVKAFRRQKYSRNDISVEEV